MAKKKHKVNPQSTALKPVPYREQKLLIPKWTTGRIITDLRTSAHFGIVIH